MRRGRKAGPRRIDPESFVPVAWVSEKDGTAFLVCGRSGLQQGPVTGGPKEAVATAESFIHGAGIRMPPDLEILLGFQITHQVWRRTPPEEHGLSKRCAQIALAEAWHGIRMTLDVATMGVHLRNDGEAWSRHKKGVRVRNIAAAMHWDEWERTGVSMEERANYLTGIGRPCTAAQLARFAEERGL